MCFATHKCLSCAHLLRIGISRSARLIAPDETTNAYVSNRIKDLDPAEMADAARQWLQLQSDENAVFAVEHRIDTPDVAPHVTWGTRPRQAIPIRCIRLVRFARIALIRRCVRIDVLHLLDIEQCLLTSYVVVQRDYPVLQITVFVKLHISNHAVEVGAWHGGKDLRRIG